MHLGEPPIHIHIRGLSSLPLFSSVVLVFLYLQLCRIRGCTGLFRKRGTLSAQLQNDYWRCGTTAFVSTAEPALLFVGFVWLRTSVSVGSFRKPITSVIDFFTPGSSICAAASTRSGIRSRLPDWLKTSRTACRISSSGF